MRQNEGGKQPHLLALAVVYGGASWHNTIFSQCHTHPDPSPNMVKAFSLEGLLLNFQKTVFLGPARRELLPRTVRHSTVAALAVTVKR